MYRIDLARLRRNGVLGSGLPTSLNWSSDEEEVGSVRATALPHGLRLEYRSQSAAGECQDVHEVVPFVWTAPRLGGLRLWFKCLKCGKRCRVIYAGLLFRCRRCHDLRYSSQSENEFDRAARAMDKIVRRLDPEADGFDWADVPLRPKRMHWRTYERLANRHEKYEEKCMLELGSG